MTFTLPAETMTVTVRDRSLEYPWNEDSGRMPAIRAVEISASCLLCGKRRGTPKPVTETDYGIKYTVDAWENPCGHYDLYVHVVQEANRIQRLREDMIHPGMPKLRAIVQAAVTLARGFETREPAAWFYPDPQNPDAVLVHLSNVSNAMAVREAIVKADGTVQDITRDDDQGVVFRVRRP